MHFCCLCHGRTDVFLGIAIPLAMPGKVGISTVGSNPRGVCWMSFHCPTIPPHYFWPTSTRRGTSDRLLPTPHAPWRKSGASQISDFHNSHEEVTGGVCNLLGPGMRRSCRCRLLRHATSYLYSVVQNLQPPQPLHSFLVLLAYNEKRAIRKGKVTNPVTFFVNSELQLFK